MMEHCEGKDSSQSVRVALNIRPLIPSELLIGCTNCITVVPGEPQVLVWFLNAIKFNVKLFTRIIYTLKSA